MMYLYCIENRDGHLYVGVTNNFARRLVQHSKGRTRSTNKGDLNWEPIWYWRVDSYEKVLKMEMLLHRMSKDWIIDFICRHTEWDDSCDALIKSMRTSKFQALKQADYELRR